MQMACTAYDYCVWPRRVRLTIVGWKMKRKRTNKRGARDSRGSPGKACHLCLCDKRTERVDPGARCRLKEHGILGNEFGVAIWVVLYVRRPR